MRPDIAVPTPWHTEAVQTRGADIAGAQPGQFATYQRRLSRPASRHRAHTKTPEHGRIAGMTERELDEALAMLCHLDIAAGPEGVADAVADMPKPELERLLVLAVAEILEARSDVEHDLTRLARRLEQRRD
jgi:hypothetical protein